MRTRKQTHAVVPALANLAESELTRLEEPAAEHHRVFRVWELREVVEALGPQERVGSSLRVEGAAGEVGGALGTHVAADGEYEAAETGEEVCRVGVGGVDDVAREDVAAGGRDEVVVWVGGGGCGDGESGGGGVEGEVGGVGEEESREDGGEEAVGPEGAGGGGDCTDCGGEGVYLEGVSFIVLYYRGGG